MIRMAGPAVVLREIHRLRRFAKNLENEIERGPLLLKTRQAKMTRQEEALREAQEAVKRLKVTNHEKEVLLKSTLGQIAKHEKQLNEAGSKKEYDVLKTEIAAEKKNCQELEDEILNCLIEIDERTAQLPELEKAIQQAKADFQEFQNNSERRVIDLKQQLDQTLQSVKEIEATLPDDIRAQVDRVVTSRGEDAMAAVENKTCMACYTEITAQALNNLNLGQFTLCKSCGRALYLPESSPAS
jgi:predicted  nucleic acid-binding Zn-ribbon protein